MVLKAAAPFIDDVRSPNDPAEYRCAWKVWSHVPSQFAVAGRPVQGATQAAPAEHAAQAQATAGDGIQSGAFGSNPTTPAALRVSKAIRFRQKQTASSLEFQG